MPIYFDPNHTFSWPLSVRQQDYLRSVQGRPKPTLKVNRANIPALCVEGKTTYGVHGSTFKHVMGMWPAGSGSLVASKMYTTLSRPTGSKAYATLTSITDRDLKRLYVPKDILAEERRLAKLAANTRIHYNSPDDPPSAVDHELAARRPAAGLPAASASPRSPPTAPAPGARAKPPSPRSRKPSGPSTTPSPHLAQTRTSKQAGLDKTRANREKKARLPPSDSTP